jgi:hypothetical protein
MFSDYNCLSSATDEFTRLTLTAGSDAPGLQNANGSLLCS